MISNIVEGLEAVKFTASEIRIEEFTTDQYGQECIDLITLLRKEGRICDTFTVIYGREGGAEVCPYSGSDCCSTCSCNDCHNSRYGYDEIDRLQVMELINDAIENSDNIYVKRR